ncbi:mannitol dehydrogenase family protein [Pontiella sp.]|uniref:mannitol dehydrogenase family protein n=1 Tax=Pontiella sp. TaxID=2837462 RepID=UPI0035618D14
MKKTVQLKQENLPRLADRMVVPTYDRGTAKAGIVHVGVGGFHRSHEAYYTDALMNETGAAEWGICGVGLREADRKMRDILKEQDFLYTLLVKHPDGKAETRVIGSIVDFMLSVDNPMAVIDKMAHEDTKIVSLTITEGGYNFHPVTGEFMFNNPDVQHDLAHPDSPKLVFGYLTAALKKRQEAGVPPFTVQSCDNVQHNGDMTKKMLLAFAREQDPELGDWIEANVCFPNAMVDRITPVTTPVDIALLASDFGVADGWPCTCEPFCQWVIEDNFSNGRPAWEKVGAQFVPDVTPYEKMKIRLLNAGHSVLGLLGSIHGHETIDGAVADPLFAQYLRAFMDREATPVLDEVEGINLDDYKDSLIYRFGNPNIKDSLARICLESSAKLPKFLISTIRENLAADGGIEFATLVIAAWCLYSDTGLSRHGVELEIVDEMKDELHQAAAGTKDDVLSFLRIDPIFGDLVENERFTALYTEMVEALYADPNIDRLMEKNLAG